MKRKPYSTSSFLAFSRIATSITPAIESPNFSDSFFKRISAFSDKVKEVFFLLIVVILVFLRYIYGTNIANKNVFSMDALKLTNEVVDKMSSKRIAEKTGKRHDNVVRDIRTMLEDLEKSSSNLRNDEYEIVMDYRGFVSEIKLNERLSLCLGSGYSIPLRMAIIDDWAEMKAKQQSAPILPQTYAEALRALADEHEQRQLAEHKNENLQIGLDNLLSWVSIIKVSQHNNVSENNFKWWILKKKSQQMGYDVKHTESGRFKYQNLYRVDVFRVCYPQYKYDFKVREY